MSETILELLLSEIQRMSQSEDIFLGDTLMLSLPIFSRDKVLFDSSDLSKICISELLMIIWSLNIMLKLIEWIHYIIVLIIRDIQSLICVMTTESSHLKLLLKFLFLAVLWADTLRRGLFLPLA